MRVAGIARDEHARQASSGLALRHVVEPIRDALADLIDREPSHISHVQRIGPQDALSDLDHLLLCIQTEGFAIVRVDLA
jgi:hypothetical protein